MQERASFAKRFSSDAAQNVQTWQYVDATTLWDLPAIALGFKGKSRGRELELSDLWAFGNWSGLCVQLCTCLSAHTCHLTLCLLAERFNLTVTKHTPDCVLPNMTEPLTAFQRCPVTRAYDLQARHLLQSLAAFAQFAPDVLLAHHFSTSQPHHRPPHRQVQHTHPIYVKNIPPDELPSAVMLSVRDAAVQAQMTAHPKDVLIDLPCTLFAMEFRKLPLLEDVAKLAGQWSPAMNALADKVSWEIGRGRSQAGDFGARAKVCACVFACSRSRLRFAPFPSAPSTLYTQVIAGIRASSITPLFNGVHLRMEKDAADWALNTGGPEHYWDLYKLVMARARFNQVR